jgi:hypothetical protein
MKTGESNSPGTMGYSRNIVAVSQRSGDAVEPMWGASRILGHLRAARADLRRAGGAVRDFAVAQVPALAP